MQKTDKWGLPLYEGGDTPNLEVGYDVAMGKIDEVLEEMPEDILTMSDDGVISKRDGVAAGAPVAKAVVGPSRAGENMTAQIIVGNEGTKELLLQSTDAGVTSVGSAAEPVDEVFLTKINGETYPLPHPPLPNDLVKADSAGRLAYQTGAPIQSTIVASADKGEQVATIALGDRALVQVDVAAAQQRVELKSVATGASVSAGPSTGGGAGGFVGGYNVATAKSYLGLASDPIDDVFVGNINGKAYPPVVPAPAIEAGRVEYDAATMQLAYRNGMLDSPITTLRVGALGGAPLAERVGDLWVGKVNNRPYIPSQQASYTAVYGDNRDYLNYVFSNFNNLRQIGDAGRKVGDVYPFTLQGTLNCFTTGEIVNIDCVFSGTIKLEVTDNLADIAVHLESNMLDLSTRYSKVFINLPAFYALGMSKDIGNAIVVKYTPSGVTTEKVPHVASVVSGTKGFTLKNVSITWW